MALETIEDILRSIRTMAVVGCSRNDYKDAHTVPAFMKKMGYNIIPVNPNAEEVFGLPAFDNLIEAYRNTGTDIELVNVFRPADELPQIVEETLVVEPRVLWTQLGIVDDEALSRAEDRGIRVVSDRCLYREYRNLFGETPLADLESQAG